MDKETKTLHERLAEVQAKLNAPKSRRNTFGNYNYRSAEDILDAVKPLLKEQGLLLTLSDTLVHVGDRYYIKSTAWVGDKIEALGEHSIAVEAYAREEEEKKGMDGSQITGTASSYARKYALNGLFLIDDTKDADTDEHHVQTASSASQPKAATPRATAKASAIGDTPETTEDGECSHCGKHVPGKSVYWSNKKFGRTLCWDDQEALKNGELGDPKENIQPQSVMDAYGDESMSTY